MEISKYYQTYSFSASTLPVLSSVPTYWKGPWSEMSDEHFQSMSECFCSIFPVVGFNVTDYEHYDLPSLHLCRRPYKNQQFNFTV